MEKLIAMYQDSLKQKGKASETVRSFGWHLRQMAAWFAERGVSDVRDVSSDLLLTWGAALWDKWQDETIKLSGCAVRGFFGWLVETHVLESTPAAVLKTPRVKKKEQRTLSDIEIQKLLESCDTSTARGKRSVAIISLLADSGVRSFELCGAVLSKLDLKNCRLVVKAKGGDEEIAHFSYYQ